VRLYEIMRVAVSGMRGNPLRSILTVLGVVIGVTAVILMISLGEGAKRQVTARIQGLGSNLLIINPGRGGSRTTGFGAWGSGRGFTTDLVGYLEERCALCKAVAPEAAVSQTVKYSSISLQTSIVGITPAYFDVRSFSIASGEPISTFDVEDRRRVAVLGSTVASELFKEADPLGKVVRIGTQRFTVIGVLASKGQSGFTNTDDQILVPLSTLQRRLSRNERLRAIYVEVIDPKSMAPALEEVKAILFARFGNEDAYFVNSQAEILETMESTPVPSRCSWPASPGYPCSWAA
jgi:putative ABC transport system permease protein